jgi:PAS domain S-box-containing protein
VLSAIRDVSEQKQIEQQLRKAHEELDRRATRELSESRSRLALIMDSSKDAIIGKDLDGIVTAWNKGASEIYGYTAEEMIGQPIYVIVPPDRKPEIEQFLDKIKRGEVVDHHESVRITKDKRLLNMAISLSPMRDVSGRVIGASVIARDITAEKRVEEQLRQSQKMEAVGRLAGGVAHDFNNILGIMTACTELLRDRIERDSPQMQYIDTIRKAAERGASLTRQLLAFSRKQVVQPKIVDLNERLKELTKLLRPTMQEDVETVISPKCGSAIVEIDPGQFDQIILNLAVNARDAMPKGGKLIIETSLMQFDQSFADLHPPMSAGDYVMIAVSDTGTGMDEATRLKIFEPFFTTKDIGKGTGLGLATVYGIVRQSGGYIWVYSESGRGTTFKIYLPSAADKLGAVSAPEFEAEVPRGEGTTILVVEDDDMMRMLTRQMLEQHGFSVIEASDGKEALQRIAGNGGEVNLILTDVVMRNMSGPELALHVGEKHPGTRIVYMSGYTGELIAEHNLGGGITLLDKPFTRSMLLRTIHAALQ